MKWNSIVVKLGTSILFLVLAILLPLGFIMNQIFTGFYFNKVQEQINELSSRYASSITSLEEKDILNMFELLATMTDQEIVIVNEQGIVVANSGLPSLPKGERINADDLSLLVSDALVQKEYYDKISKRRYLSVGRPIISQERFLGGIFVLASVEDMYQSLEIIKKSVVLAGTGAVFLAFGFTFIVSRKLSNPLLEMEKATRKIAKGDLNTRISSSTKDEIGSLATAINDLAVELHRYRSNRREFFANISHELRTPITYLEGYANALENNLYRTEDEKRQYLQIIQQEAGRMSKLVQDLFELSKMEEGKLALHFEEIDLIEVVENALLKTKIKAQEKRLQLEFNKVYHLPTIYADGLRMEQIVINLIENAIRYTEKGTINIKLTSDPDRVKLTVEDTGIGIPNEDVPYLFERFYRVEKSRSREFGGSGLGLAIVKQLVELQNGTISVKSDVGKGTCFELIFPISKGDAQ
ncbi:HAMP domain-containing sensor histidine kinase [Aeromicrobium ponti]|uniref:histidine kinase n=2 Tax=Cytobacillus oceanisediminis TaxID=665099 RepID=A0A562JCD9_9BACI|nr:ATP-binding protein [Cytobacillus oceanisediminis]TWH80861.1 signal transduction histidine kinase [Cytobacillus oceanisediminis]